MTEALPQATSGKAFFEQRVLPHGFLLVILAFVGLAGAHFSRAKPLWLDEILTEHICRADSLEALWERLTTGPQSDPPGYYVFARTSIALFGLSPFSLRLPALVGILVYLVSVYVFLARRYPVVYARLGTVLCALPPALQYACEARPYGLWLGSTGLMLLCWQTLTTSARWRRGAALVGLAGFTALAVSSHFCAVLVVAAFAGAELFRSVRRQQLDPWVWLVLVAGAAPLVLYRPIMDNARAFVANSWAAPKPNGLATTYLDLLLPCLPVLVTVVAVLALSRRAPTAEGPERAMPADELVLVVLLAALPFLGFALAVAWTNNYQTRYVLPAAAGVALLLTVAVANAAGPRHVLGYASLGVALLSLLVAAASIAGTRLDAPYDCETKWPVAREAVGQAELAGCPLVTDNLVLFVPYRHQFPNSKASLALVCDAGDSTDAIGRRLRDRYDLILEPGDLRSLKRCVLVPELNRSRRLEVDFSRQGARVLGAVRLWSGGTALLMELPDGNKPTR